MVLRYFVSAKISFWSTDRIVQSKGVWEILDTGEYARFEEVSNERNDKDDNKKIAQVDDPGIDSDGHHLLIRRTISATHLAWPALGKLNLQPETRPLAFLAFDGRLQTAGTAIPVTR